VGRYAGFCHVIIGMKNPTPYDFPYSTAFGRNGQEEVVASLAQGRSPFCVDPAEDINAPLFPKLIRHFMDTSVQRAIWRFARGTRRR